MSNPQPPQGYDIVIQEVDPDGSTRFIPGIPAECMASLMVWNPWQAAWEKPKYLVTKVDAILAYDPSLTHDTPSQPAENH